MKLANSAQMREIDRYVIEDLGISGAVLMANAARHVAEAALELLPDGGKAAVFCGTGNNGGDGIGSAALLMENNVPVRVFLVGDEKKLTIDSREMLKRLEAHGGWLEGFEKSRDVGDYVGECCVIIDAMFGIGLNSELRGAALEAVKLINSANAKVIAADIASGVHADTGAVLGEAVMAEITVTFSLPKPGHFLEPGVTRCGDLRVCDIGIPPDILTNAVSETYAVMPEDISLPRRRPDTHKGDYGRDLIIAGSVGFTGAPVLSARAASRMGAGLVFLGVPESIYSITAVKCDEEMPFPLPDDRYGKLAANAAGETVRRTVESSACLIGPGLGRSPEITEIISSVLKISKNPVILDADGINALSENINVLDEAACPVVLTPHEGEFARLGGDISHGGRIEAARSFAKKHGCVLVLKGHRTITAMPDGSAYINTTGGPAMAKGGSGDVLAGMIMALIGQKFPIKDAVIAAVHIHGLAGDLCAEEYGEYSVTAGDLIRMLPKAVKKIGLNTVRPYLPWI